MDNKLIKLTKDQFAIVDNCTYEDLSQYKWRASWNPCTKTYYAVGDIGIMHRKIINAPKGIMVDHINGDTLDNRLANLRLATNRQNQQNQHKPKSSIYPGVCLSKGIIKNKWQAAIMVNKKIIYLGHFPNEEDAFTTYVNACKEYGFCVDHMVEKFKGVIK